MLINPPWWAQLAPTEYDRESVDLPSGYTGHFGDLPPAPKSGSGYTITRYRREVTLPGDPGPAVDLAGALLIRMLRGIQADDRRREAALLVELFRRAR